MSSTLRPPQPGPLPRVSPLLMRMFTAYGRGFVRRHFHSLRVLKGALPPADQDRPMVIYLNHAAWWDPLVCLLLARKYFPGRTSFAPIEAAMLARYGFFRRLGFFGIERSASGARTFLRTAHAVLASSEHALWMTPQGRFADVRERPLRMQEGLSRMAVREPDAVFVPLAIEYSFWTEIRPEILTAFGKPILPRDLPGGSSDRTTALTGALETAQNELTVRSCKREPSDWLTLHHGKTGIGAIYDTGRRLRAKLSGEPFAAEHAPMSTR